MKDNHISISEAKGRLGELVKRAAYGKEHFILEFRDKPQAAIVSYEAYEKLRAMDKVKHLKTLRQLAELRRRIADRTSEKFDAVADIRQIRDDRAEQL
jgi:prevent-host-death family protein